MSNKINKKEIGQALPSPGKIKLGDYLAIPLGDNSWGYVRALKDASFSILAPLSQDKILDLNELSDEKAIGVTSYCQPWDKPTWVYLGNLPYEDEESAWASAKYSYDIINPEIIKIYHKGQMTYTKDKSKILKMRKDEGLLFPGSLVVKIRTLHGLSSDKKKIEEFAPFHTPWNPKKA